MSTAEEDLQAAMGAMAREKYLNDVVDCTERLLGTESRFDITMDLIGQFHQTPYTRDDVVTLLGVSLVMLAEERKRHR